MQRRFPTKSSSNDDVDDDGDDLLIAFSSRVCLRAQDGMVASSFIIHFLKYSFNDFPFGFRCACCVLESQRLAGFELWTRM